jgi:spore maturation protein CgeD
MPAVNPRVSVLLTAYNRPGMLVKAIESVLAQTFTDFELIILDDNSPHPDQRQVMAQYWDTPQVRFYKDNIQNQDRRARVRYAVLANIGLKLADGDYITYLCDDDLYLPHRLEVMVKRLDRGDCQVVYGSQRLRYESDGENYNGPERGPLATEILDDAWWKVDHSSVMHTKVVAMEVDGWDEDPQYWKYADAAFWRRLNKVGHKFYPVGEYTDVRLFHSNSETASERLGEQRAVD